MEHGTPCGREMDFTALTMQHTRGYTVDTSHQRGNSSLQHVLSDLLETQHQHNESTFLNGTLIQQLRTLLNAQRIPPSHFTSLLFLTFLPKNHAQVRHATLQLIRQFFGSPLQDESRSFPNPFQRAVCDRIDALVQWTIFPQPLSRNSTPVQAASSSSSSSRASTSSTHVIPAIKGTLMPVSWARRLQVLGVKTLLEWAKLLPDNITLALAIQHVQSSLNVPDLVTFEAPHVPLNPQQERARLWIEGRMNEILTTYGNRLELIKENSNSLSSCLDLLVPLGTDTMMTHQSHTAPLSSFKDTLQHAGLVHPSYTVQIHIPTRIQVTKTVENQVIFDTVSSCYHTLIKHVSLLQKWIDVLVKADSTDANLAVLKELIDAKECLFTLKVKAEELEGVDLKSQAPAKHGQTDSEVDEFEDEEFIDVSDDPLPSNDLSLSIGLDYKSTMKSISKSIEPLSDPELDPDRAALLAVAPVVEYDEDLYYWDKQQVYVNQTGIEFKHRYLGESDTAEKVVSSSVMANLKCRQIVLRGERPAHISACKAPLKNGKGLCARKDLLKCPVHGPIIPRDDNGIPLDEVEESGHVSPSASSSTAHLPFHEATPLWMQLEGDVSASIPKHQPTTSKIKPIRKKSTPSSRLAKKLKIDSLTPHTL